MRRVHHGPAAHAVEVHDLDRRVVVVDRVVLGPGADVGTGGKVAKGARLPVAARGGVGGGVHPTALLKAEDVHPGVSETPSHGGARRARTYNQYVHGTVHVGLFPIWRGMPRSALKIRRVGSSIPDGAEGFVDRPRSVPLLTLVNLLPPTRRISWERRIEAINLSGSGATGQRLPWVVLPPQVDAHAGRCGCGAPPVEFCPVCPSMGTGSPARWARDARFPWRRRTDAPERRRATPGSASGSCARNRALRCTQSRRGRRRTCWSRK